MKPSSKLFICIALSFIWSCEQTDFDLQTPLDEITIGNADYDLMVTGIIDQFGREIQEDYFINLGEFVRYFALGDEYVPSNTSGPNIFRNHWEKVYGVGKNIQFVEDATENDESLVFHRGIARIVWVFTFANMVDLHGDVPYSQAINPVAYPHPVVDKGEDIYEDLFKILDNALADFEKAIEKTEDQTINPITEAADIMYHGNIESWIRLANSLKLRLLLQTRLVNPEFSKTQIDLLLEEDKFITTEHDFEYPFGAASSAFPSGHPFFEDPYIIGRISPFITNHFIYALKESKTDEEGESITDPRIRYYLYRQASENNLEVLDYCWDPLEDPNLIEGFNYCFLGNFYLGKDHGYQGTPDTDSYEINTLPGAYPVGGAPDNDEGIIRDQSKTLDGVGINPIILSSFVNFYKAEAALILGTSGDAETYLRMAVEESIEKTMSFAELSNDLTPTNQDVETYVDAVVELYQSAATENEKLRIIIDEFYLAAWGSPFEIYNAYRRTGYPSYPPLIDSGVGGGDIGDFPRSMPWPKDIVEDNNSFNGINKPETEKVFWDTNPDDFIH
jgi:hypothetical protein